MKKWGRNKIKMGLMAKRVFDETLISKAFDSEIEIEDYLKTLRGLIEQKENLLNEPDKLIERDKLYRYLLGKGYESELVSKELTDYFA